MIRTATALVAAMLAGLWSGPAAAQQMGGPLMEGVVQSPILVIEFERLFAQSAFGERITSEIEAEGTRIAAENRRIEAELTNEERSLTEERETMEPDAFRALAQAFDEKVQRLRREQDAKARGLSQRNDEARRQFVTFAQPVLQSLMRDSNAAVILERRTVFAAADLIDVTDLAVSLMDAEIGDGSTLPPVDATEAPVTAPGAPQQPLPDAAPREIEQP